MSGYTKEEKKQILSWIADAEARIAEAEEE